MNITQDIERPPIRKIISRFTVSGAENASGELLVSRHQRREILIPLSGCQHYMLNGRIIDFEPGTAGLVDRFMPHTPYYTKNDQNLLQLWVLLYNDYVKGVLTKVFAEGKYDIVQSVRFPMDLGRFIERRWDQLNQQSEVTQKTVMDFMKVPIEMVLDDFFLQANYPSITPAVERLSDFLKDYIRTCFGRNCSISELARISGYSTSHLSHTFQKETGETIRAFIDRVRLDYTRAALNNGSKQKEIAYVLGFSSPAAFWNWFRKHR